MGPIHHGSFDPWFRVLAEAEPLREKNRSSTLDVFFKLKSRFST
jgi:hypothetical protein